MRLRRAPQADDGFTLIELLISVVIMGVITVPLTGAVLGVLHNTTDTSVRLALSHDVQISAAYFAQDVASVGRRDAAAPGVPLIASIQTPNVAYDAGPTCGTSATPPAIVRILADDYDTTTTPATQRTDVVAYYIVSVGTERRLHRMKCVGGAATPVSDVVVSHNLSSATPVVTCAAPVSCTTSTPPQQVTMSFTLSKAGQTYPAVLNGQRRQS